jgi:hypothetical protein
VRAGIAIVHVYRGVPKAACLCLRHRPWIRRETKPIVGEVLDKSVSSNCYATEFMLSDRRARAMFKPEAPSQSLAYALHCIAYMHTFTIFIKQEEGSEEGGGSASLTCRQRPNPPSAI